MRVNLSHTQEDKGLLCEALLVCVKHMCILGPIVMCVNTLIPLCVPIRYAHMNTRVHCGTHSLEVLRKIGIQKPN